MKHLFHTQSHIKTIFIYKGFDAEEAENLADEASTQVQNSNSEGKKEATSNEKERAKSITEYLRKIGLPEEYNEDSIIEAYIKTTRVSENGEPQWRTRRVEKKIELLDSDSMMSLAVEGISMLGKNNDDIGMPAIFSKVNKFCVIASGLFYLNKYEQTGTVIKDYLSEKKVNKSFTDVINNNKDDIKEGANKFIIQINKLLQKFIFSNDIAKNIITGKVSFTNIVQGTDNDSEKINISAAFLDGDNLLNELEKGDTSNPNYFIKAIDTIRKVYLTIELAYAKVLDEVDIVEKQMIAKGDIPERFDNEALQKLNSILQNLNSSQVENLISQGVSLIQ